MCQDLPAMHLGGRHRDDEPERWRTREYRRPTSIRIGVAFLSLPKHALRSLRGGSQIRRFSGASVGGALWRLVTQKRPMKLRSLPNALRHARWVDDVARFFQPEWASSVQIITQADAVADWMVEPLLEHSRQIRDERHLAVGWTRVETLAEVEAAALSGNVEALLISTSWREQASATIDTFARIRRHLGTRVKLVYLDSFDQSSSPFLGLLEHVDLYVKKQLLAERARYLSSSETGYVIADHFQNELGIDLGGWHFGSTAAAPELLDKLRVGWNVGTRKSLARLVKKRIPRVPLASRGIDIHFRVGNVSPEATSYYIEHRRMMSKALTEGHERDNVVNVFGNGSRLTKKEFRAELADSKLCVSPFGWGEVTDRDFEIVLHGGALVKPDMSHVETEPDIYEAGRTYIPVRWDGADLAETCAYYLQHLDEAQRIADAAYQAYEAYFDENRVVSQLAQILARFDAHTAQDEADALAAG